MLIYHFYEQHSTIFMLIASDSDSLASIEAVVAIMLYHVLCVWKSPVYTVHERKQDSNQSLTLIRTCKIPPLVALKTPLFNIVLEPAGYWFWFNLTNLSSHEMPFGSYQTRNIMYIWLLNIDAKPIYIFSETQCCVVDKSYRWLALTTSLTTSYCFLLSLFLLSSHRIVLPRSGWERRCNYGNRYKARVLFKSLFRLNCQQRGKGNCRTEETNPS